ncbi:Hypothetical predicted protein [Cloeon dipterum]|uniref:Uncharacterized protein n=1 Tax=Cloeon dipterum TaxID=197152 RepID=A0A8S1CZB8_9INSE|nr:Hypothetical predicted protein [Cloeon dipterum]
MATKWKENGKLRGFCVQVLLFLNILLGHPFAIHVLNVKRYTLKFYISWAFFVFSNSLMLLYTYNILFNCILTIQSKEFEITTIAFVTAGCIGVILAFLRLINQSNQTDEKMILAAARKSLVYLICNMSFFAAFSVISVATAMQIKDRLYDKGTGMYNRNVTAVDKTMKYIEKFPSYTNTVTKISSGMFVTYVIIAYFAGLVELAKLTICDVNHHFFYYTVIGMLRKSLREVSQVLHTGDMIKIEKWIFEYHNCIRILQKINNVTAPNVFVTVILCTLQACVTDYIVALGLIETFHASVLSCFGTLALLQIYIYCLFGHKIRLLVTEIHTAAHRVLWIRQSKQIQHAIMMIASATDGPNSVPRIGAPFFDLSMEFFISIVGVTITYFLVLMQFKK